MYSLLLNHFVAKVPETQADLTGRTFIVTGSNTGLGLALAVHLARRNPTRLILAVRNVVKGETAKTEVIAQTGFTGVLEVWPLDMEKFESVKSFADRANTTLERLDGAVLNAGINIWSWGVTPDGWERILQVNALATGLLGVLLLPLLQSTAKLPAPPAFAMAPHLTFTGSAGMFLAKFTDMSKPDILQAMNIEAEFDSMDRYPTSKLFDLFLARKIAKLPQANGVVVNVVDPGFCYSELGRDLGLSSFVHSLIRFIAWSSSKGALNLLYSVLSNTAAGAFISSCKEYKPPAWTLTEAGFRTEEQVWKEMVQVWGKVFPEVLDIATQ
ncbi:hypothetical protein FB45DRAFT_958049 [Roridomyces roridus]|uniref:NAD(P)-binding protein n=1 Tax=Roridomyces roridus TaxID=1738132 RepID=A0AAD7AY52_9AGAR|nr:hypothetical protein FB45DRAFT_958049 [Roridomyces roridus]